ncbi:S24 family peptidase [Campylobacter sp. RM16188]|nr:S24 family peptidase [Campylobacter sp. RM16188]
MKLTSLNAHYQDIVLKDEEVNELKVIGKVVCKFSINMKVF